MKRVKNVDEYIACAPMEIQGKLKELRKVIRETVPGVVEKISYSMPYYGYKGRYVYFAYTKTHIGLYIPPPIVQDFEKELKDYSTSMATVRFSLTEKLPTPLIKKLLTARKKLNEQTKKAI